MRDLYQIHGFMHLLMKPRNGLRWTAEDKSEIRSRLRNVASALPLLAVFTLPGGMLLLPFLAWYLDRRKKQKILSISPDSIKTPLINKHREGIPQEQIPDHENNTESIKTP
jgi:hypothetical protein